MRRHCFQSYAQLAFLETSLTHATLHLRVHFQEIHTRTPSLFTFVEESYSRILKWVKWKLRIVKINFANFLRKSEISVLHLSTSGVILTHTESGPMTFFVQRSREN